MCAIVATREAFHGCHDYVARSSKHAPVGCKKLLGAKPAVLVAPFEATEGDILAAELLSKKVLEGGQAAKGSDISLPAHAGEMSRVW